MYILFSNPPAHTRGGLKDRGMFPLPSIALANALHRDTIIEQASPDLLPNGLEPSKVVAQSNADWLALTCYQETMGAAKMLCEIGRATGKKVVLGGAHVCLWGGKRILEEIPEADYAIIGEGELPLRLLVDGSDQKRIPGLWWRDKQPITNQLPLYFHDWTNEPPMIQGYSAFDYSEIWKIHEAIGRTGHKKPFSIMGLRGCGYALRSKRRCSFCAMPIGNRLRCRSPKYFWEEIVWAVKTNGVDVIQEHSDSLLGCSDWLQEIARSRPQSAPPIWCYGRADEITEETIDIISKTGIEHIYIGVEGGSDQRLEAMRKGVTLEQVFEAIRLCKRHNISVQASFVIGYPGETKGSLSDTLSCASRCLDSGADDIVFHEFILRKGLRWFESLVRQYPEFDHVQVDQGRLQEEYWKRFNPHLLRDDVMQQAINVSKQFPRSEITAWNI